MRIASDSRIYPTDNDWGVPLVSIEGQATAVHAPVVRWGSVSRSTSGVGTWVFYVDDYRFTAPSTTDRVIASSPVCCVEPNYSVFDWTPRAEVLWGVYRKRRFAADLHAAGITTFVDLCMPQEHRPLALLGVPRGWRAYATRGFETRPSDLRAEHSLAAEHAGCSPLFLVFGGGDRIAAECRVLGAAHVKAPRNE